MLAGTSPAVLLVFKIQLVLNGKIALHTAEIMRAHLEVRVFIIYSSPAARALPLT
jgi:hypothetical protein